MSEVLPKPNSEERSSLLDALLEDQCKCWEPGQAAPKRVEAYLAEYPALRSDPEAVLLLIYNEYRLRKERGEAPGEEEYLQRFPAHEHALRQQFEVDQGIREPLAPSTPKPGQGTVLEDSAASADAQGTTSEEFPQVTGYTIQEELGKGAMGVVYKAWHQALRRPVALKMIRPGTATGREELVRFRREAQAVARLQHPYIVQIYEIGDQGGQPYLALELVEGGSLAEHLHGMPQPASQAAQLIEILARAIHYAHQCRIVHRDLKPGNVLLTSENTPKITDFGLAKRLDGICSGHDPGSIAGTPSYMAPEQANPEKGQVGPHTDVYALGVILYQMLTGQPPFRSAEPDTLKQVLDTLKQVCTQEPVPPRRLQPQIPRDLEAICLKCLQKEPAQRYASALALAEELDRFLEGKPVLARPMNPAERLWRWCRRNPLVASLLTGLFVVLASGFGVSTWLWLRAEVHRANERRQYERTERAYQLAGDVVDKLAEVMEGLPFKPGPEGKQQVAAQKAVVALLDEIVTELPSENWRDRLAWNANCLGATLAEGRQGQDAIAAYRKAMSLWAGLVNEFPANPVHRWRLGMIYSNLGGTFCELKHFEEAEEMIKKALSIRQQFATDFPGVPSYQHDLGITLNNLGAIARDSGKPEKAREHWEAAIRHHWEAVKARPQNNSYREALNESSKNLTRVLFFQMRKHAEAAQSARESLKIFPERGEEYWRLGHVLANCMLLAEKDEQLPPERRKALAQEYADEAVKSLWEAVRRGFSNPNHLRTSNDFNRLRQREDFKKLLAQVEALEKTGAR